MNSVYQDQLMSQPNQFSFKPLVFLLLSLCVVSFNAWSLKINQAGEARVCDHLLATLDGWHPPDFTDAKCQTKTIGSLNPQARLIWVQIKLDHDITQQHNLPLGLFISGKTATQAYFNGHSLGSNGRPGLDAESETPGLMDAVFAVPVEHIKKQDNVLVLLMSAHHGLLSLARPIHNIFIGTYQRPTDNILRHYWPSFLPFGVLLLGVFYLSLVTWMNNLPSRTWLLTVMVVLAAAQLFVEVYRGLVAYPYPQHEVRLVLILMFSLGFGLVLMVYVMSLVKLTHRFRQLLGWFVVLLLMVMGLEGFDRKSIVAILLPIFIAIFYASWGWYQGQKNLRFVTVLLIMFLLLIVITAYSFIDTVYYYAVAGLVFMLMAQQAKEASLIKEQQLQDQERANRLQQIIDQQSFQDSTDKLKINSSGKVEWVMIKDIAYCKGAGDYVELILTDGQTKLYYGSVTELSLRLPTAFLKTHRSYLVNTTLIQSLERNASGAGQLHLLQGAVVPVSRRILPQVKEKLG